jgi:uncharacterized repeat protein (TIGR03803 family)
MNPDGSNYQVLHASVGHVFDQGGARETMIAIGSTLYGTKSGAVGSGAVFSIEFEGSNYQQIHAFNNTLDQSGANPSSGLTLAGSTLYGTTLNGGAAGKGVLFKVDTDGSNFQVLHSFSGGPTDGANPMGNLTRLGSTLFGTTILGGEENDGSIYSINLDGTGYEVLHVFEFDFEDLSNFAGIRPHVGLTPFDSKLYGVTGYGLYSINPDGTGFELVHAFGSNEGSGAEAELLQIGQGLYGTTPFGGAYNNGTAFAYFIPEPSSIVLAALGLVALAFNAARRETLGRRRQTR